MIHYAPREGKPPGRPFVVSFSGWSGSGKTACIEALIRSLASTEAPAGGRTLKVAAVKRSPRAERFGEPGKDSARFFDAGADTAFMGGAVAIVSRRVPEDWNRATVELLFPDADIVLAEGRVLEGALVVAVSGDSGARGAEAGGIPGSSGQGPLRIPVTEADAVVTADGAVAEAALSSGKRVFRPDDAAGLAGFIVGRMSYAGRRGDQDGT